MSSSPLSPSGDEGRSLLRREMLRPEYHEEALFERLLMWLTRRVDRLIDVAGALPGGSVVAAVLVLAALVAAGAWLATRANWSKRRVPDPEPVLVDTSVTAAQWQQRARQALTDGRFTEALLDAFRAVAATAVEDGLLDDLPGATAHEVAGRLADLRVEVAAALRVAADRFDEVRYGAGAATADDVHKVLDLIDPLRVGVR
ncbi:DUF4129 domain-containing protein [Nocardioides limicola]|uniref:DUF4129 domain-containing protein n=1 Tax=Nocardioides limicola TaxID=2803368 RepID=UPI00193BBB76|nr:DUF4129 domain-containing protein [Nocardioides sp. DJM-14]